MQNSEIILFNKEIHFHSLKVLFYHAQILRKDTINVYKQWRCLNNIKSTSGNTIVLPVPRTYKALSVCV